MNLGIIAHNSKKVLIEDFCIAYKNILAKHEVYATGTTGRRIEEATSLHAVSYTHLEEAVAQWNRRVNNE